MDEGEIISGNHLESEERKFEKVLGHRILPNGSTVYLTKIAKQPYSRCKWMTEAELKVSNHGSTVLAKYNMLVEMHKTQPPFYDSSFDIPDRIIAIRNGKYLMKWMHLSYEDLTWEEDVNIKDIAFFNIRHQYNYPNKDNNSNEYEPINSHEYIKNFTLHGKQLDCVQIETFNYILYCWRSKKDAAFTEDYYFQSILPTASFVNTVYEKYHNNGPFLIIVPIRSFFSWYEILRKNEKMITLSYDVSKESRKIIHKYDFMDDNGNLKFHVMLTTPEVLIYEIDRISAIHWNFCIITENELSGDALVELNKSLDQLIVGMRVTHTKNKTSNVSKKIQHLIQTPLNELLKDRNENNKKEIPEIIKINCPLNLSQKLIIKKLLFEEKNKILSGHYISLIHKIHRICVNPLLIHGAAFYFSLTNLLNSSTKIEVLDYLIHRSLKNNERILIASDSQYFCSVLFEFCNVMKYNELNSSIDPKIPIIDTVCPLTSGFPKCYSGYQTLIIHDGTFSIWEKEMNLGKASTLKHIYKLEVFDCLDNEINEINNSTGVELDQLFNQQNYCQKAAILSIFKNKCPQPSELVEVCESTKDEKESRKYCFSPLFFKELNLDGFWDNFYESNDKSDPLLDNHDKLINETHQWTKWEGYKLLHGVTTFGWGRNEAIRELTGMNISDDFINSFIRYILRFAMSHINPPNSYPIICEYLQSSNASEYDDKMKFESTIFKEEKFIQQIIQGRSGLLKKIELCYFINIAVEKNMINHEKIRIFSPIKLNWWTEEMDKSLLLGVYKYGHDFDYFSCDDDEKIREIVMPHDGEKISYPWLSNRAQCIAATMKMNFLYHNKFDPNLITFVDDSWTLEEKDILINYLMKFGINTDANFLYDFEYIKQAAKLENKTAKEIGKFINALKKQMEKPYDFKQTGLHAAYFMLDQRIDAMHKLRQIFYGHSDKEMVNILGNAPRWRFAPQEWTKEMEFEFFSKLLKCGFGSQSEILQLPIFSSLSESTAISQDFFVIRRTGVIYEYAAKENYIVTSLSKNKTKISSIDKNNNNNNNNNLISKNCSLDLMPPIQDTLTFAPLQQQTLNENSQTLRENKKSIHDEKVPNVDSSKDTKLGIQSNNTNNTSINSSNIALNKASSLSINKSAPNKLNNDSKQPLNALEMDYPLIITPNSFIHNIGSIIYDKSNFHTERYIYPVGFKSSRLSASVDNPDERVRWYSQIVEGEESPIFRVWMEDSPKQIYEGATPTAPWSQVLKAVANSKRNKGRVASISGPEAFLLASPITTYLIQTLPNSNKCSRYVMRNLKDNPIVKKFLDRIGEDEKNEVDEYDFNEDEEYDEENDDDEDEDIDNDDEDNEDNDDEVEEEAEGEEEEEEETESESDESSSEEFGEINFRNKRIRNDKYKTKRRNV